MKKQKINMKSLIAEAHQRVIDRAELQFGDLPTLPEDPSQIAHEMDSFHAEERTRKIHEALTSDEK
jgi:hypothetical protein